MECSEATVAKPVEKKIGYQEEIRRKAMAYAGCVIPGDDWWDQESLNDFPEDTED